jgi:hypothetical protein
VGCEGAIGRFDTALCEEKYWKTRSHLHACDETEVGVEGGKEKGAFVRLVIYLPDICDVRANFIYIFELTHIKILYSSHKNRERKREREGERERTIHRGYVMRVWIDVMIRRIKANTHTAETHREPP